MIRPIPGRTRQHPQQHRHGGGRASHRDGRSHDVSARDLRVDQHVAALVPIRMYDLNRAGRSHVERERADLARTESVSSGPNSPPGGRMRTHAWVSSSGPISFATHPTTAVPSGPMAPVMSRKRSGRHHRRQRRLGPAGVHDRGTIRRDHQDVAARIGMPQVQRLLRAERKRPGHARIDGSQRPRQPVHQRTGRPHEELFARARRCGLGVSA